MNFLVWLPLLFAGFAGVSVLATAVVLRAARRAQIIDIPNDRSSHSVPTPRGGGIAIVGLVTVAGAGALAVYGGPGAAAGWVWVLGGLFVAAFSFLDDFRPLPAAVRLALQALVAVGLLAAFGHGWPVLALPGMPVWAWGWLGWILLVLWIVGLTNVYNFMDGIDGIAGIQGAAAGVGWLALGVVWNDPLLLWTGLALSAGCAGFLVFNWSPAKIFMGDVGSAYLGFTFAALPLLAHAADPRRDLTVLLGCAVLFVWPFLFDGAYTILHRIRRRENLMKAHRGHLYQRLVIAGCRHVRVSVLYGILAAAGWPLAALWVSGAEHAFLVSVGVLLGLAAMLAGYTKYREARVKR